MINKKFNLEMVLLVGVLLLGLVSSQSYSSSNPQYTSFGGGSAAYLSGQGIQLYGNSFGDSGSCGAGQDFVLQISPVGCSPSVIRSDLLEEQNVPVFCPIVATQVNPLITIKAIDSMTFSGKYPPQVSGVGFHPAQAAIRSQTQLLNYPVLDNVGYAVIVLKKTENESAMPDYVQGNLTAKIRYDINNAFGIGDSSFSIPQLTDSEWDDRYGEYSFWESRGYLRAEDVEDGRATIGVYEGNARRISSFNLAIGQVSNKFYLKDSYCLSGLQVKLDGIENPDTRVRLQIDDDFKELKVNERFLENRCVVKSITKNGIVQSALINCRDDDGKSRNLNFEVSPSVSVKFSNEDKNLKLGDSVLDDPNKYYLVYMDTKSKKYLDEDLEVWFAKLSAYQESSFVGVDGKMNIAGLNYFQSIIKTPRESYNANTGQLGKRDIWKLEFEKDVSIGNNNLKLNGYAKVEGVGSVDGASNNYGINYSFAISNYTGVVDTYPTISQVDQYGSEVKGTDSYAVASLKKGVILAETFGDTKKKLEFLSDLERISPTEKNKLFILDHTKNYFASSGGLVSQSVSVNGKYRTINFVDVYEPSYEDYGVELSLNGLKNENGEILFASQTLTKNVPLNFDGGKYIQLTDLNENFATFVTNLDSTTTTAQQTIVIKTGETKPFSIGNNSNKKTVQIRLNKINLNKVARVSVLTNIDRAGTEANINFKIGIEKRAIDLSPDRIDKMIQNLNETIEKWQERSDKLGTAVDGLQKACIATAGILTVKNLVFGGGTDVVAREKTMVSVRNLCKEKIARDPSLNMRTCIDESGEEINALQKTNTEIIDKQNLEVSQIKADDPLYSQKFADIVASGRGNDPSATLIREASAKGFVSTADLQQLRYCDLLKARDLKEWEGSCKVYSDNLIKDLTNSLAAEKARADAEAELTKRGLDKSSAIVYSYGSKDAQDGLWSGGSLDLDKIRAKDDLSKVINQPGKRNIQFLTVGVKEYVAILRENPDANGDYAPEKVCSYTWSENTGNLLVDTNDCLTNEFRVFKRAGSFSNPIKNPQVQYFGSAPDKDYPSIVPFPYPGNKASGFYVGVRHLILNPSTTASGAPKSYWVCNAGDDGIVNFNPESSSFSGGDVCAQFKIEGGVIVGADRLFGLTDSQTTALAAQAEKAILEAQKQFGKSSINIFGMTMSKGEAAFDTPTLQCQDFMSPTDCAWLFNVCDPVICPSSRCDMGGSAPRANVIQSGIIGSLLLCLPNFGNPAEGKVVIPVCLSGLKAGIDGYLSIVKAHRDCLIEKQATGKNVGICDEVYSIYLCDLFWKEAGSFKDIIIPKILDFFSGRSPTRGGGEYLGAEAAWTNAKASVDYFTKSYASNSYEAFKVQGVNDIKESVCKNSLSAAFPEIAALESMTEPSSPPQFHAKFDESPFTDVTVPPTSQYSVFYTIFAGNSDGVNFQVYLKSPEGQSIYSINPTYFVAGRYIAVGQTASEKKDFIAPSGYRELCVRVNAQEECGFKEVSTSFAVDWVTDKIVSNEATTSGIKTEAECTSGTQFNSAALANTNLGAGASNFVSPDLYASGITRICSSIPPDGNNQSTKWKLVGYCDDTNIKCWIDTSSVKDAIEISGIQGDTLSQIGKNALDLSLPENTKTMDEFNNLIDGLKRDLVLKDKLAGIPGMVDDNINNVLFDWQKVQLMYVKAQAYDQLARIENGFASAYVTPASSSSSTSSSSTSTGGGTSTSDTTIISGGTATTGTNTASATQTIDATSTATVPTPNLNLDNTGFFVGDGKVTQATDKDNIEFRVSATGCDIIQYSILKDRFWIFDGKISNLENLRDVSKYLSLPVEKYIVKQIKCLDISGKEIFNIPKDFEKGWKLEVVSGPIIATSTSS